MRLMRKKSFILVFSTVFVALVIFTSTLVGCELYIQWKHESFLRDYKNFIYRITSEIFKDDIEISSVRFSAEGGTDLDQVYGFPVLAGKVKNNSAKVVTSILLEFSFVDSDSTVIQKGWIYPLGGGRFSNSPFFSSSNKVMNLLLPGESVTFRHLLRKNQAELLAFYGKGNNFAKDSPDRKIEIKMSMEGLSVI